MIEQGLVVNVITESPGASAVSDSLAGDTIIDVDDAFAFNEDGGQVQLEDGSIYPYLRADMESDIIVLSTPLLVNVMEEDRVWAYPRGRQKIAIVQLDDEDEGVRAIVPPSWSEKLPDGMRDPIDCEEVFIDDSSGRWEISAMDEDDRETPYAERWRNNNVTIQANRINASTYVGVTSRIRFGASNPDNTGVRWENATDSFWIERPGKYLITATMTMGFDTGNGNRYVAEMVIIDEPIANLDYYRQSFGRSNDSESSVGFSIIRHLDINEQVCMEVYAVKVGSTAGSNGLFNLPEQVLGGRGKCNMALTRIAD